MQTNKKRYAIICSGGNAPGMNNIVIAFCKKCLSENIEPYYFEFGFKGIVENKIFPCDPRYLEEFINRGNTIIGSGRLPSFSKESVRKIAAENLKANNIDGLIVAGGDGSFQGAYKLSQLGVKVICIPATIDNDISCTHYTIGYDTCLNQVSRIINDTGDCFSSHNGVNLIEIMGRACPDLTIATGVGSNIYMVTKYNILKIDDFIKIVTNCKNQNRKLINFVITEKMYGIGKLPPLQKIAESIEKATGYMTRVTKIGYIQRGGIPSARDRLLANFMINKAVNCLKTNIYNVAIARINKQCVAINLSKAIKSIRHTHNRNIIKRFNKINLF